MDSIFVRYELYLSVRVLQTGVHGDEDGAAGVEGQLDALELEGLDPVGNSVLYGVDLLGDDAEHPEVDPVELVEASPGAGLSAAFEELAHRVVVEPVAAVEDDALLPARLGEVLARLRLAGASDALRGSAEVQLQCSHQGSETPALRQLDLLMCRR